MRIVILILTLILLHGLFMSAVAVPCPKCAVSAPDDARFCIQCGTPLTKTPAAGPSVKPTNKLVDDTSKAALPVPPKVRVSREPLAHFLWAEQFFALEDYANAKDEYTKTLQLKEDYVEAVFKLGLIHFRLRYFDDAVEMFNRALKLDKKLADAEYYMGVISRYRGNTSDERKAYEKVLKLERKHRLASHNLGVNMILDRQFKKARRFFETVTRPYPEYWLAWVNLAVAKMEDKGEKDAKEHLERAHELNPSFHLTYYNMGVLLEKEQAYLEALAQYQNCLNIQPDHKEAMVNLGAILRRLLRYQASLSLLDKAVKQYPKCAEAWLNRSLVQLELGLEEAAAASRKKAEEISSQYKASQYDHGITFGSLSWFDDETWPPYAVKNPRYSFPLSGQGELPAPDPPRTNGDSQTDSNSTDPSKTDSGTTNPAVSENPLEDAAKLMAGGKFQDAVELLKTALRTQPEEKRGKICELLGDCFTKLEDHSSAVRAFETAVKHSPAETSLLTRLAATYGSLSRWDEQVSTLKKVLLINPGESQTYYLLGMAYIQLKNSLMAVRMFKLYLKKHPDSPRRDFVEKLINEHEGK